MELRSLENTALHEIVDCLIDAFSIYPVKMPSDTEYWKQRWKIASVDYSLSFGCFDGNQLAGFIINGIDFKDGKKVAFNTGTGVRPSIQGQKIPSKLYSFAIPYLRKQCVEKCGLEVITKNAKAIHVYKQIGFSVERKLDCYKGNRQIELNPEIEVQVISESEYYQYNKDYKQYAWDFDNKALKIAGTHYAYYSVCFQEQLIGKFVFQHNSKYLAQYYTVTDSTFEWKLLFEAIYSVSAEIKINNVDGENVLLGTILRQNGLINHISQYEMGMDL